MWITLYLVSNFLKNYYILWFFKILPVDNFVDNLWITLNLDFS